MQAAPLELDEDDELLELEDVLDVDDGALELDDDVLDDDDEATQEATEHVRREVQVLFP